MSTTETQDLEQLPDGEPRPSHIIERDMILVNTFGGVSRLLEDIHTEKTSNTIESQMLGHLKHALQSDIAVTLARYTKDAHLHLLMNSIACAAGLSRNYFYNPTFDTHVFTMAKSNVQNFINSSGIDTTYLPTLIVMGVTKVLQTTVLNFDISQFQNRKVNPIIRYVGSEAETTENTPNTLYELTVTAELDSKSLLLQVKAAFKPIPDEVVLSN